MQFSDHVMYAILAIVLVAIGVTWIKDYAEEHGKTIKDLANNLRSFILGLLSILAFFVGAIHLPKIAAICLPILFTIGFFADKPLRCPRLAFYCHMLLYFCALIDFALGIKSLVQFQSLKVFSDWHYNKMYVLGSAPFWIGFACAVVIPLCYFIGGRPTEAVIKKYDNRDIPIIKMLVAACLIVLFIPQDEYGVRQFYSYVPRTKSEYVSGYYRSDGTHVRSYYRRPRW